MVVAWPAELEIHSRSGLIRCTRPARSTPRERGRALRQGLAAPSRCPTSRDKLENKLHELVCAGKITLGEAQGEIANDWIRSFNLHVGKLVCP